MINKLLAALFGSKQEQDLRQLLPILHEINQLELWALKLADADFTRETAAFREQLQQGKNLQEQLPRAFALAREAARRLIGERPYDVQILGGLALHQGKVMEMKTGEGKTLSLVAPVYLNSLTGDGVHIVTVNDYLAERDALWMGKIFNFLGLTVGVILSGMDNERRRLQYACDITYVTNNELGFDYLRDNMCGSLSERVQRKHNFCVIDEVDSILIDEARTPLIISGSVDDDIEKVRVANTVPPLLKEVEKDPKTGNYPIENALEKTVSTGHYKLEEKNKRVTITEEGLGRLEEILQKCGAIQGSIYDENHFDFVHYINQALKSHYLFHVDQDYVIADGQVKIVDEFTGRILEGRRYSDGLHQAIEAKENIRIAQRNRTLATVTFQKFFSLYQKLAGMTGTAATEQREFGKIYQLEVIEIPTNRPVARLDANDVIYLNEEAKYKAIVAEVATVNKKGQPMLIGTVSVENSETLSKLLRRNGVKHEVLNAKNHHREALIIAEAGALGSVTIATNMAGRGTDIKLGGNPEFRARRSVGSEASEEEYQQALQREQLRWQDENEQVKKAGGLYVLGTERHESRRIDNQLRGRSGRQGDPGYSRFFLSLDDSLMRLFAGDRFKQMMKKMGMVGDDPLEHNLLTRAVEKAQGRVEDRNYEMRKHLLDYDDVLHRQRTQIYSLRNKVLEQGDILPTIMETGVEMISIICDNFDQDGKEHTHAEAVSKLLERGRTNLGVHPDPKLLENYYRSSRREIETMLTDYLHQDSEMKKNLVGQELLNKVFCQDFLRLIDVRWQEHLEQMESLREAVYLRSYAQKNPLVEYRNEGFAIFDEMVENIDINVARKFFNITIEQAPEQPRQRQALQATSGQHRSIGAFGATDEPAAATANSEAPVQYRRSMPKVGRNEPCPCGSNKKYKYCHGRE